jgi:PAS domain S-box-containing protein
MISVLYVDDEDALLEIGKLFLERSGSFQVSTAQSGADALGMLDRVSFDAIVSDFQMPEMDGIALLKKIRAQNNNIPFILFTGKGREEIVIEALNNGASFYLQKGSDIEAQFAELGHKIRVSVDRMRAESELRESEEKFRTLTESTSAGILMFDAASWIHINSGAEKISGYTKAEIARMNFWDILHPEDRELCKPGCLKRFEMQVPLRRLEMRILRKDGEIRWVDFTANSLMHKNRHAVLVTGIDITERKLAQAALAGSEQKYRNIFDNAQVAIFRNRISDGLVIECNDRFAHLFGYENRDEVCGSFVSADHYFDPGDRQRMLTLFKDNILTGFEVRMLRRDRSPVWVLYSARLEPENGYLEGVGTDISEQKRVEEELREKNEELGAAYEELTAMDEEMRMNISELQKSQAVRSETDEIYNRLVENLPDYVIIHQPDIIVFVNREGARLMGSTPEKVMGTSIFSYAEPQYHDLIQKNSRLRLEGVEIQPYEIAIRKTTGELQWVIIQASPIRYRDKPAILTVMTDITDRKLAEQNLKESEENYRRLIEQLPDFVMVYDQDLNVLYVNPACERIMGYSGDEMRGKTLFRFLAPSCHARVENNIWRRANGETVEPYEIEILSKTGHKITAILLATPVIFNHQPATLSVSTDITDRKKYENALKETGRKLNLMNNVTRHDIRNQLTAVLGYVNLAEQELAAGRIQDRLSSISKVTRRILEIIDFSKDYQDLGVKTPLWQLLPEKICREKDHLGYTGSFEISLPEDLEIFSDPLHNKAIYNIMENSLRHGHNVSQIQWHCLENEGDLIIIYEDNGIGIPAPDKEKIFSKGFGKNTGLGLFLAREILAITGMTIHETGEPGKGVRFEIRIPHGNYRFSGGPGNS